MGAFRDPSTINNVGPVGSATNPLTGTALGQERENQKAIKELIGTLDWESLMILDGGITPVSSEIIVDTEDGTPADDLTTINLTSDGTTTLHTGMRIKIKSADPSRVITVKHLTGGGNIRTADGHDVVLSNDWSLDLKLQNGVWVEQKGRTDWSVFGTAATANLTTSNTDGTVGRVLKVGDGGWMGQWRRQVEPLGYPTSVKDITNQTKVIGADSVDNGVSQHASGIHFATHDTWGRLRVHHYVPSAWVQGGVSSTGTGWTSRVVLSDNLRQTTGQSTEFPMSQKAVTDALGQPSMTGSATLYGTFNNTVQLTGIVTTLVLEVGDVIRIQCSGYDKLHSVEDIVYNDLIVVNFEHAGNRGNGSLKLPDTTATVTITRIAKWYNAPLGLGQAWVDVAASGLVGTIHTNTAGRPIQLNIVFEAGSTGDFYLDGHTMPIGDGSHATVFINSIIQNGISYRISRVSILSKWLELR